MKRSNEEAYVHEIRNSRAGSASVSCGLAGAGPAGRSCTVTGSVSPSVRPPPARSGEDRPLSTAQVMAGPAPGWSFTTGHGWVSGIPALIGGG